MPGTFSGTKPKAFNRHFCLNLGTAEAPQWMDIKEGIASRGADISEDEEKYEYMSGRGTADTESASQAVARTFSGNRFLGDPVQDAIFIDRMYNLDKREIEYLDYYDNPPASWKVGGSDGIGNGYKGKANLKISDDGGGDAGKRETIEFSLLYSGPPVRGTVTVDEAGVLSFAALPQK